jgi:hypothetical protein
MIHTHTHTLTQPYTHTHTHTHGEREINHVKERSTTNDRSCTLQAGAMRDSEAKTRRNWWRWRSSAVVAGALVAAGERTTRRRSSIPRPRVPPRPPLPRSRVGPPGEGRRRATA